MEYTFHVRSCKYLPRLHVHIGQELLVVQWLGLGSYCQEHRFSL